MDELTPKQQALLGQYHRARVAWECGSAPAYTLDAAYLAALNACIDAGFDPFHHPISQ
jgi:hypothetical protein